MFHQYLGFLQPVLGPSPPEKASWSGPSIWWPRESWWAKANSPCSREPSGTRHLKGGATGRRAATIEVCVTDNTYDGLEHVMTPLHIISYHWITSLKVFCKNANSWRPIPCSQQDCWPTQASNGRAHTNGCHCCSPIWQFHWTKQKPAWKKHKNTNSKKHMVKICENQHFFKICIPKKKFTADPAICEGLTYTKSTYQLCKTCLN